MGNCGIIELEKGRYQHPLTYTVNLIVQVEGHSIIPLFAPPCPPNSEGFIMPISEKYCPACQQFLAISNFSKNNAQHDGLQTYCKVCWNIKARKKYHATKILKEKPIVRIDTHKRCPKCKEWKTYSEFNKQSNEEDGHNTYCKVCHRGMTNSYTFANKEKVKLSQLTYRKTHREEARANSKKWFSSNKEKAYSQRTAYRAKRAGNGGSHTSQEWEWVKFTQNYTCLKCGKSEPVVKLTKDHIVPISKGGTDNIGNIQGLCKSCNSSKSARFLDLRGKIFKKK